MKANFRTCPQCSTRNRLDKEFCVKCGEPLEGIKVGDPTASGRKGKPGILIGPRDDEGQSPFVALVFVIMTLGVAFAGWRTVQEAQATPTVTPPDLAPRVQPSIPSTTPIPPGPGVDAYVSGVAAMRNGDFTSAVRWFSEAVRAASRADYRLALAEALEKSGTIPQALSEYEAAASFEPRNVRYTSEWAKALNRAGRDSEAVRAYEAALQMDADNLANLRELSNLHLKVNDFARARPHLQKIVQLQPDDLTPKQNLARALEATGDLVAAATQYRQILTLMPDAALTRALLSDLLVKQGRTADALQLLAEGLTQNPNAALLYREKGRILDRQGNNSDAVAAYREYIRLAPGAADLRTFQARIDQLSAFSAQTQGQ